MINQTLGKNYDKPLVSVIVPTYDNAIYIHKCILSLIEQTYNNIEVIVVDDGSHDVTESIVQGLVQDDQRIRYIKQNNYGVCIARNKGIAQSNGKYLLFVDSDDYLKRNYVEKLVDAAELNHSELVIGGYSVIKDNDLVEREIVPKSYARYADEMSAYSISSAWGRLYLKSYWMESGLQFIQEENARGEDTPISYYANLTAKNISIVNNAGYCYVQHTGSAMTGLAGFKKYHFPYETFLVYLTKALESQYVNSVVYYKIGVCKLFAQFCFLLAHGAKKEQIKRLCDYILLIDDKYLKLTLSCSERKKIIVSSLPLTHKVAILLLSLGVKSKLLYFIVSVRSRMPI